MRRLLILIMAFLTAAKGTDAAAVRQPIEVSVTKTEYGTCLNAVPYTNEDIDLLARCIYAEAGNQDETGKRLIASTVLNRVESPGFPDTITEVITQKSQFVYAASAPESCYEAAYKELEERTDSRVLYFLPSGYPKWGTPLFQHGGHYFSGKAE